MPQQWPTRGLNPIGGVRIRVAVIRHLKVSVRGWLLALALTLSSVALVLVVIRPRLRARCASANGF